MKEHSSSMGLWGFCDLAMDKDKDRVWKHQTAPVVMGWLYLVCFARCKATCMCMYVCVYESHTLGLGIRLDVVYVDALQIFMVGGVLDTDIPEGVGNPFVYDSRRFIFPVSVQDGTLQDTRLYVYVCLARHLTSDIGQGCKEKQASFYFGVLDRLALLVCCIVLYCAVMPVYIYDDHLLTVVLSWSLHAGRDCLSSRYNVSRVPTFVFS